MHPTRDRFERQVQKEDSMLSSLQRRILFIIVLLLPAWAVYASTILASVYDEAFEDEATW